MASIYFEKFKMASKIPVKIYHDDRTEYNDDKPRYYDYDDRTRDVITG